MSKTNPTTQEKVDARRQEVRQAVKNACDMLNADGVDARNYVEQIAWLFFLKAFDEAESEMEESATFEGEPYTRRLDGDYRWSVWSQWTDEPDKMLKFVDGDLWKKLLNLGEDATGQRFQRIFSTVRNYSRQGVNFARVVKEIDKLHFGEDTDVHVLSEIYENLLKDVAADSAGYAGEFYTQRHIIRAMVEVTRPQMGERVYDPCFGTGGFLGEAADYMRRTARKVSADDMQRFQNESFYGLEIKPLTYLLGTMNLLLHGVHGANLELANTLETHSANVPEKQRYDVILSNPPYGGKMQSQLQENFTIRSGATEVLFVQHIMTNLAKGGRAAIIVPEGVLFRSGPNEKLRQKLLTEFNVHTVLSLPAGCFLPYTGVKTNVVFFNREKDGKTTESVWFYELTNDGFELKGTRKPIDGSQIPDFLAKWEGRVEGDHSWVVPLSEIEGKGWDLSAKNRNVEEDLDDRSALEIVEAIKLNQLRIAELAEELEQIITSE
jgi:type I restriction enzyme M protein